MSRFLPRAAWTVAAVTILIALVSIAVEVPAPASPHAAADPTASSGGILLVVVNCVVAAAFAALGALVVGRQPRNPIGWLLILIGVSFVLIAASNQLYLRVALPDGAAPAPVDALMWVGNWAFIPAFVPATIFLPLLFPTGRPPTPAWRLLAWIAAAAAALVFVGSALKPGALDGSPAVENPLGWDHVLVDTAASVGLLTLLPCAAAAIGSLVLRYRRSEGLERQQLKWLAASASLLPVGFASGLVIGDLVWPVILVCLLVVAAAVAVAVLRYRLYDIDVVINRALVYTSLTVTLAVAYVGAVLLLQLTLRPLTEQSDLAVAASTLVVAALFGPARRRIQKTVDRRFYRRRYDAQQTVAAFSGRLRDGVDLDALTWDLRYVVREAVQPAHVSIWLRPHDSSA